MTIFKIFLFTVFIFGIFFINSCKNNPVDDNYFISPPNFRLTDFDPAWSPDGKTIAYVHWDTLTGKTGIYLIDTSGNNKRIIYASPDVSSPTWSPDGQRIAFSDNAQIFKMKINGDNLTQLTFMGRNFFPDWSPDGKWIAYDSNIESPNGMNFIWKMKNDGTQKIRIIYDPTKGEIRIPDWAPNGQQIVHIRYIGVGASEIFVMDSSGANPVRMTFNSSIDRFPQYSPDGTKIAFTSQAEGNTPQIWVMDSDGSNLHQLTTTQGYNCAWSPDGSHIVYTDSRKVNGSLWLMKSDGSNKRQLTFNN